VFEKLRSFSHVQVTGRVTGEADITITGHTHNGRTFTPDMVTVEYDRPSGTTDGPWSFDLVTVSGYLRKKDGTPGVQRGSVHFLESTLPKAPRWVLDVVKDKRPDPLLDALTGPLTAPYGGPEHKGKAGPDSDRRGALRLALSRMTDEQVSVLATALTDAAQFVAENLADRIVGRRRRDA
jgi:hypothetical protein